MKNHTLKKSLALVTAGGCLFMVFMTGTTSPLLTEFLRRLGATEWHFGLLGGLPLITILMQFPGALLANRVRSRKIWFIALFIIGRLMYLPAVFLPNICPGMDRSSVIMLMILFISLYSILSNFGGVLFFSWMADLIPHRVLNSYWGVRQKWMQAVWVVCYVFIAAITYYCHWPVELVFPGMAVFSVAAGVTDILLFLEVREPPNRILRGIPAVNVLIEPFRHPQYRIFVLLTCCWMFSCMPAAAFMQIYAIKVLGMSGWQATLAWCTLGIGSVLSAPLWGRLADKHGQKPVIITNIAFKPLIALVFLLVTPGTAMWILPLAFTVDGIWNAGLAIGQNGYMLKISPKENKSMFAAVVTGLPGLIGGLAAIMAGKILHLLEGFSVEAFGREWSNFHVIFAASFFLRVICMFLALKLREPESSHPMAVVNDVLGAWPLRFFRFPVGLYRSWLENSNRET